jgi:nucleoid-associated protein YgaU
VRSLVAEEVVDPNSAVAAAAIDLVEAPIAAAEAVDIGFVGDIVAEGTGFLSTGTASTVVAAVADNLVVAVDLDSLADAAIALLDVELETLSPWLCLSRRACRK